MLNDMLVLAKNMNPKMGGTTRKFSVGNPCPRAKGLLSQMARSANPGWKKRTILKRTMPSAMKKPVQNMGVLSIEWFWGVVSVNNSRGSSVTG